MPNRILKETVCTSSTIDELGAEEERFFYRLIVQCDDYGRFHAHPGIVRGHCFPRKVDIPAEAISQWLSTLQRVGLIKLYTAGGEPYLQVLTWERHQQTRAKRSKFPAPTDASTQPVSTDDTCEQVKSDDINREQMSPYSYSYPESNTLPPKSPEGDQAAKAQPVPKPKKQRVPITDQDIEELVGKYAERFGSALAVRECIEDALNHQARFKAISEKRYVDKWLRTELERRPVVLRPPNGRTEVPVPPIPTYHTGKRNV